jgi:AcrR family transcriptional regulator
MAMESPTTTDGRRARRDANRTVVLDAVLDLFAEGEMNPTPEQVALRAGLSPRSVYRYVASRDELLHAAIERKIDHLAPLFALPDIGEGSLESRVDAIVRQRIALYRAMARTNPATRALALRNTTVAQLLAEGSKVQRKQVEHHFAPELSQHKPAARRQLLDALDITLHFESLHHLAANLQRTDEALTHTLRTMIFSLLKGNQQ